MDLTKKRKLDENGFNGDTGDHLNLSPAEARKIIQRFTPDQLMDILQDAVVHHPDVLTAVRSVADTDVSQRKLFIRGLGWDTTTDRLRSLFSTFGDLEEAVVILDKTNGRVTVTQLAAAGNSGSNTNAADIGLRKIYVSNVPPDLPADKLLAHFSIYGEIEEGPLGFDKQTGKSKGFALFVYKTPEGAQASLVDPVKNVEGRQLNCKLAITDSKQGKRGPDMVQGHGNAHGDGMGMTQPGGPGSGPATGQYGGPVGLGSYGGYGGGIQGQPQMGNHQMGSHPLNSSVGGLSSAGNQAHAPASMGGAGGYATGLGGHYGGYGGGPTTATGFGAGAGPGGATGTGATGGLGGSAVGLQSLYRLPSSGGMQAGGYLDSGHYGLSASSGYQNQHHPPTGASPIPRVQPGSMYPNVPPYY